MNQIKSIITPIISEVEKILNRGLDNIYLNTGLKVFLVLYAALAAPQFPPKLVSLMDNIFVRIGLSFLIVFMALRDPGLALIIAISFVITLQTANKLRLINTDLSTALPGETSWLPSAQREDFAAGDDLEEEESEVGDEPGDVAVESDPLDELGDSDKSAQSECARCADLIQNNTCRIVD